MKVGFTCSGSHFISVGQGNWKKRSFYSQLHSLSPLCMLWLWLKNCTSNFFLYIVHLLCWARMQQKLQVIQTKGQIPIQLCHSLGDLGADPVTQFSLPHKFVINIKWRRVNSVCHPEAHGGRKWKCNRNRLCNSRQITTLLSYFVSQNVPLAYALL